MEVDIRKRKEELAREKYEKHFKAQMKSKRDQNQQQHEQKQNKTVKKSSKTPKFDSIGARLYKKGVEKKIEKEKFIQEMQNYKEALEIMSI